MKKINSKKRYVPYYQDGSGMSEIAKYLKAQIAGFQPQQMPKNFFTGAALSLGGALGSDLIGLGGQRTEETPFIPNPSDVTGAFRPVPVGTTLDLMDNFYSGQQNSLARSLQNSGLAGYDVANALAKPMSSAASARSQTALGLVNENADLGRKRAGFNIEVQRGMNASENQERTNSNQKLALISQKLAEGAGAFGNLSTDYQNKTAQLESMNNAKLSTLMNQLFMASYLDKLYGKDI